MTKLEYIGIVAVVGVIGFTGYVIYDHLADRPVGGDSVIATVAPAAKKQPKVARTIKKPVETYAGNTKANLKMSPDVIADPNKAVIAASQVPGSLRSQTVSTVVDVETGAVTSYTKTDPYPWLAIERRGEIKLAYGYKLDMATRTPALVGRLQVGYDVVRVKAFTAGVLATIDTDREAFVGAGISYKW